VEEHTLRSGTLEQLSTGPEASPLLQAMVSQHQSPRAGAAAATVSSNVTADEDESHDGADQTAGDAATKRKIKVSSDHTNAVQAKGNIDTTLVKEEERTKGSVDLRVYSRWIVAAGGGLVLGLVVVIFGFLAPETANAGSQLWLGVWTSEGGQEAEEEGGHSVSYYMLIYSGICGLGMFLVMLRTLTWAGFIVTAAKQIHSDLLSTVLRLPMAFFDSTPTGRIINRFSHDIAEIDTQLGVKIQDCLEQVLLMMSALLITVLLVPQLIIFLVPIGFVYRSLMNYYRATNRDIKRLESVSRSPLYAHFSESLAGLSTIRGYAKGEQFVQQNQEFVERYVQASTYQAASRWWLGMRIDGLSASLSFLVAMFLVTNRETLSPAVAGLLLVQTTKAIQNFRWVLKRLVDVESAAVCLERVMSYTDLQTPRYLLPGDPQQADFPNAGKLVFENVCMRYRPGLPLALDEASFEVRAGESVGVCGRTGAGKSTLANAIFRMCELSSGRILIDGYDISKLGLETLRTNLGIVPQDPAMFRCVCTSTYQPRAISNQPTHYSFAVSLGTLLPLK
jgi:ABC-type multidrug transport system fused ATPase/permease subunit